MMLAGAAARPLALAERVDGRTHLTTDRLKAYLEAVEGALGADVDYAQLVNLFC